MTRLASLSSVFLVSAFLAALPGATPAKADANAAFCLKHYKDGGAVIWACDYYTLAQCQASSSGQGGSCVANPYSAFARLRARAAR